MSQQPFQAWQNQPWNYQQPPSQQQQQPSQHQTALNLMQSPTDIYIPTQFDRQLAYPMQFTNPQQVQQSYMNGLNPVLYQRVPTNTIQQHLSSSIPLTQQDLFIQPQSQQSST